VWARHFAPKKLGVGEDESPVGVNDYVQQAKQLCNCAKFSDMIGLYI